MHCFKAIPNIRPSKRLMNAGKDTAMKCSKQTNERRISVARRRKARKHNPECKYIDFPELLFVCETVNARKFSKKSESIWCGGEYVFFSANDIFVNVVLAPTRCLETVVCSFASHFFEAVRSILSGGAAKNSVFYGRNNIN
ncbi:unnamed protein product [Cylicocyclus nassatus]|uniref:Uncharacterized protein n=1 Tax=Cylicocyclus nassatus TaxID=53992 RepID=A0AA36DUD5_CYLNA|nr:unnamed protein product [Cylicocyclus nassatus]